MAKNQKHPGFTSQEEIETKQAVITSEALKSGTSGRKLRVRGFRGAYGDAHFGDDHISRDAVKPETEEALRKQFKNARIEAIEEEEDQAPGNARQVFR